MLKIAEIESTPNPNAMKFILKEPLTWGITHSYDNAGQAKDDVLACPLFDIEHVTNVFYVDHWITVTRDGGADWQELMRKVAERIRAAPAADAQSAATVAAATTALADLSPEDQQRLDRINALLDEQVRRHLQSDGGDLYVLGPTAISLRCTIRVRAAVVRARSRARSPASRIWFGRSNRTSRWLQSKA